MRTCRFIPLFLACGVLAAGQSPAQDRGAPWRRHVIDDAARGADGVRLADVNGDRLPDIATGWEEAGVIRVYLHPDADSVRRPWPAVTVGAVDSPEDAGFADLDGDGSIDVVSCCEGDVRSVFVHWAPRDPKDFFNMGRWRTEPIPVLRGRTQWMFCLPMQVDGEHGVDLVVGSKGQAGVVGWLEAPAQPRDLAAWRWHPLRSAGWIMSLDAGDMDEDGDLDVLASDRKGPGRGVFWLENPASSQPAAETWAEHRIGGEDREVMFLDLADLDGDGLREVVVATRDRGLLILRRATKQAPWERDEIALAPRSGGGKGVRVGDIDRDGRPDVVYSCEGADRDRSGVVWLSRQGEGLDSTWKDHEISGPAGTKFDLVQLLDLDQDGDLDVVTCEERENLGVVWYENPTRP
jgi:hypothetical protein